MLPENASARLAELLNKPASGKLVTSELRNALGTICREARQSGVSVEHMIVSLKSVVDRMPGGDGEAAARMELRERLVSVCIAEYYRDGDGRAG